MEKPKIEPCAECGEQHCKRCRPQIWGGTMGIDLFLSYKNWVQCPICDGRGEFVYADKYSTTEEAYGAATALWNKEQLAVSTTHK